MDERELERRMQRAASRMFVPHRPLRQPRRGSLATAGAVAVTAVVLVAAVTLGQLLAERRDGVATTPTPTPTTTGTPAIGLVPHESPILGYAIDLPEGFRLSDCLSAIFLDQEQVLGHDEHILRSAEEERRLPMTHVGRPAEWGWGIRVEVYRNTEGMSAIEWANTRGPGSAGQTIEPVVIDALEAARVVIGGEAWRYVIRGGERMYVLTMEPAGERPAQLETGALDGIAQTFRHIEPQPFPTATPRPQTAPAETLALGRALADAFAARDVEALDAVVTPRCWMGSWSTLPTGGGGSPVDIFVEELRERLESGALSVQVDPAVREDESTPPWRFYVASEWTEEGRTMRVDLFFAYIDGHWYWAGMRHHPPD